MCSLFQTIVGPDGLLKIATGVGPLPPDAIPKNGMYVDPQDRLLAESDGAPVTFNGGVGFTVEGRVCVALDGPVDILGPNSMPLTFGGLVTISVNAPIDHYIAGVGTNIGGAFGAIAGLPPA